MNLILRLWYKIVGEPCHANALRSMNKALAKLETATQYQADKADALAEAARLAALEANNAQEASKKAKRVREKLGELLES